MPAKAAPRAAVKRALDQRQLVLFYQPIHELKSRRVVAAEALLRARRRSGEIRQGAPIAAAAEKGPDLRRLDSWMIERAFRDAAVWQQRAPAVRLHVNVSAREIEERGFASHLRKLAALAGIDLARVNVEVTETSFVARPRAAARTLDAVKSLGAEVWLDDFGTGHSSLSHLLAFPLDGIKLPAAFVKPLAGDARARALVQHLVAMAHAMELRVIAEGVERRDQLAVLRKSGCDFVQGFLFSEPMPLEAFLTRLS